MQIIYASQPLGYDSATLQTILDVARKCNARDNVSGALVCRQDIYLQLLEGSLEAVNATYMNKSIQLRGIRSIPFIQMSLRKSKP